MRHWKLFALAALTAATLPMAAFADATTGADRANGARVCKDLQTKLATFDDTYATFGACVSDWTQKAHQARHVAVKACKAQGKRGRVLASCTSTRTRASLATKQRATTNAAKACAAERNEMGEEAFAVKYGENENDRNAFGKCVSGKVSQSDNGAQSFKVTLSQVGGSGVTGSASLVLKGDRLFVSLQGRGLEADKVHAAHIHGAASGDQTCASAGDVVLALTPYGTANNAGNLSYKNTFTVNVSQLSPLENRTINVHGRTVSGVYDSDVVVACGEIVAR